MGLVLVGSGEAPTPGLTDIPAKLRQIADELERGETQMPDTLLWVGQYSDGSVGIGSLGAFLNKFEIVGILTLAQRVFDHEAGHAAHDPRESG